MNIYLFLGDLSSKGGIERVTVALANGLSKFYDVTIISLYRETKELPFRPHKNVNIIYLNNDFETSMYNRKCGLFKGLKFDVLYIKRKISKFSKLEIEFHESDVLISCDVKMSVLLYFLAKKNNSKIIAIEHFEHDVGNVVLRKIRGILYPKFVAVLSQTYEDKSKYLKWLPATKHKVIPNIVSFMPADSTKKKIKQNIVLAVGRLTNQKGFDLLLKAWALSDTKGWCLKIIGDGEEYHDLMSLISSLNISNADIIPFQNDIQQYYDSAEIFVLSSRYEGLGMVLIEALSSGLACISFDCPAGPKTIITNDNGLLIPTGDIEKLSKAISLLITNREIRKNLQAQAVKSVDRFEESNVVAEWRELLNEI